MNEFAYRKLDGPNGPFFRILERSNARPFWMVAAGTFDWDNEQDAKLAVAELAKKRKGTVVELA